MATLLSVNVGLPKDVPWRDRPSTPGCGRAGRGPQLVAPLNVDGDWQGDLAGHGRRAARRAGLPDRVLPHWQEFFGRDDLEPGRSMRAFHGQGPRRRRRLRRRPLPDRGARRAQGHPAARDLLPGGIRMGAPQLPSLLVAHHRPGFLPTVLDQGHIRAGTRSCVSSARGRHALTVAEVDALLYLPGHDVERLRRPWTSRPFSPAGASRSGACWRVEARPAGQHGAVATTRLGRLPHRHRRRRRRRSRPSPRSSSPRRCPPAVPGRPVPPLRVPGWVTPIRFDVLLVQRSRIGNRSCEA